MLKINLSRTSQKFIDKLPAKQKKQIINKITELAENPNPHDSKPIIGAECLRADIGEYRIAYYVIGDDLRIPLIGKRNDNEIYNKLKRMNN